MSKTAHRWAIAWLLLLGWGGSPVARAEVILGPSQFGTDMTPYYRFTGGYPDVATSTVNNPSFYQPSLDLSGVGWVLPGIAGPGGGTAWNVTMIDSTHFISAWHVTLAGDTPVGATVNFRPAGTSSIVTRTIASLQNVPNLDGSLSDVSLGTLSSPIPSGVASYPIAATAPSQAVMDVYGRSSEVGRSNVSFTQSGVGFVNNETLDALIYQFVQPNGNPFGFPNTVGNDECYLIGGDSGSPSFLPIGNQLALVGVHAAVATYEDFGLTYPPSAAVDIAASVDSNVPDYIAQLLALGVNVTVVPEPSSMALLSMTAAGAAIGYWRRRRLVAA
jgi:PEP-CTERM motif